MTLNADNVDLTEEVNEGFSAIENIPYNQALERLHLLERTCRVQKDEKSNRRVAKKNRFDLY